MHARSAWWLLALALASTGADAARRSLRLDEGAWSARAYTTSPGACPGTYEYATVVDWGGFRFQGHVADPGVMNPFNFYCQESLGSALNRQSFFGQEPMLAELVGSNADASVSATRYTFDDFNGFQWTFYRFVPPSSPDTIELFRRDIVLVAYHDGPEPPPMLSLHPSIVDLDPGMLLASTDLDGFDGEYFCFRNEALAKGFIVIDGPTYLGRWTGEPGDEASACYQALRYRLQLFASGFEGGAQP